MENVTDQESDQRQHYSNELKFKVVKEQLTTKTSVTDICKKYGITPNMFYRWQALFFDGAKEGLERKRKAVSKAELRRISELEAKTQRQAEVISEIIAENIDLKKNLGM